MCACPSSDAEERFLLVERRLRDIVVRALRSSALLSFVVGLEALLEGFAKVSQITIYHIFKHTCDGCCPSTRDSVCIGYYFVVNSESTACTNARKSPPRPECLQGDEGVYIVCSLYKRTSPLCVSLLMREPLGGWVIECSAVPCSLTSCAAYSIPPGQEGTPRNARVAALCACLSTHGGGGGRKTCF